MTDVRRVWWSFGWILGVVLCLAPPARAQFGDTNLLSQENVYARENVPTIRIFVIGDAGTTGIWRVEPDIQLIELLALCDIGNLGQAVSDTRDVTQVSVYRHAGGQRGRIYTAELSELLVENPAAYPSLQEGDVILAETRQRSLVTVGSILRIAGQTASLILLALRLADGLSGRGGGG